MHGGKAGRLKNNHHASIFLKIHHPIYRCSLPIWHLPDHIKSHTACSSQFIAADLDKAEVCSKIFKPDQPDVQHKSIANVGLLFIIIQQFNWGKFIDILVF